MARRAFLALVSSVQTGETEAVHERMARERDWRFAGHAGSLRLWTDRGVGFGIHELPHGQGFVVGDLIPKAAASAGSSPFRPAAPRPLNPQSIARRLSTSHWGGYVALLAEPSGAV